VNTEDADSCTVFTITRNACSRSTDLGVHDPPKWVFTMGRNTHLSAQAGFLSRFETIYETYYRLSVSRTLSVQPDLQYWHHPGGNGTPSALLFLVRTAFRF
ncbi:MAG: carbohydrate porin, partial [Acidiferrobacteraceae bacterium]